uniref:YbaY family lipoprotein n=1 Tax=Thaumasiovibrio occultus TaxID=1891184 RepID=UPI000B350F00|nr:YbaY family lipoprotein [Thaumasiovibrio occultus]
MKKMLSLTIGLIAALIITACTSIVIADNQRGQVTGEVMYRERIALPDDAKITVSLQDVSKMDVAAEVISQHVFLSRGEQVPLSYALSFDRDKIRPNHTYAVSARIEVDGKLWFITDTQYRVITDPENTEIMNLLLVKVN